MELSIADYLDLQWNKDYLVNNWKPGCLSDKILMNIRRVVFDALQRAPKPDGVQLNIQEPTDLKGKLACTRNTVIITENVFSSPSIKMGIVDIFRLHEPLLILKVGTKVTVNEPFIDTNEPGVITGFDNHSVEVRLESGAICTVGATGIFAR